MSHGIGRRWARGAAAVLVGAMLLLQGCGAPAPGPSSAASARAPSVSSPARAPQSKDFATIKGRVQPVAEAICRADGAPRNCNFKIVLDTRPNQPPNAFQTLDNSGRPILVINQTLINQLKNADEIAFVLAHEAAHHIADHLARQRNSTFAGAVIAGQLAAAAGLPNSAIAAAQEAGAFAGSRGYSKAYELEADSLGAQIAYLAGYDPIRGVQYFARARDPGDVFLGTHPPNQARIAAVEQTMARLR